MKYEVKDQFTEFKPIEIKIVLENFEELENLLIRLNSSPDLFKGTGYDSIQRANRSLDNLFDDLDNIAIQLGKSTKF